MEQDAAQIADKMIKEAVRSNAYIKFDQFMAMDVRRERNLTKAKLFYAQSVSVVEFLIKKYGSRAFGQLCNYLREIL